MSNLRKSLSFVILNPDNNPTALRKTARTITEHYPECKTLCVLGNKNIEVNENKQYAEVVQGGNTITSLIDAGIKKSKTDWCFVVIAGTYLRSTSLRRYEYFLRSDKDILYPVVDRKFAFDEASLNGILMPKKAIEDVGIFGDNNRSIQVVKMLWALQAIDLGYRFLAIVGARLV